MTYLKDKRIWISIMLLLMVLGFQNCKNIDLSSIDWLSQNNESLEDRGSRDRSLLKPSLNVGSLEQEDAKVAISGQCIPGYPIEISKNINRAFGSRVSCRKGVFKYCARIDEYGTVDVTLNQTVKGQSFEETSSVHVKAPGLLNFFFLETHIEESTASVTILCYPSSTLIFSWAQNSNEESLGSDSLTQDEVRVDCEEGVVRQTIDLEGVDLSQGETLLSVTMGTPFGEEKTLRLDLGNQKRKPSCDIESMGGDDFCGDRSGSIEGNCQPGWPVFINVDGRTQNVVICTSEGHYFADYVVLKEGGSEVAVEQFNPFDSTKKCMDKQRVRSF